MLQISLHPLYPLHPGSISFCSRECKAKLELIGLGSFLAWMEGMKGMNAVVEVRADDRAHLENLKQKVRKGTRCPEFLSVFVLFAAFCSKVQRHARNMEALSVLDRVLFLICLGN
ncbi:MAG: hypothetical protein IV107_11630 [Paucibacter sp.]|nr:hypothetical protein [Roseateles sp.]